MNERETAAELFLELCLDEAGMEKAWACFEENPQGVIEIAYSSFEGRRPGGLFLHRLLAGEHKAYRGKRTGWRFVRGTHSGTYVRDHENGRDPLPPNYGVLG